MIAPDCIIDFEKHPIPEHIDDENIDDVISILEYEEICRLEEFLKLGEEPPFSDYLEKLLRQYYEYRCLSERFVKLIDPDFSDSEEIHKSYMEDDVESHENNQESLIDIDTHRFSKSEKYFEAHIINMRYFNARYLKILATYTEKNNSEVSNNSHKESQFQEALASGRSFYSHDLLDLIKSIKRRSNRDLKEVESNFRMNNSQLIVGNKKRGGKLD